MDCLENWDSDVYCECGDYNSGPKCEQGIEAISISEDHPEVIYKLKQSAVNSLALQERDRSVRRRKRSAEDANDEFPERIELRFSSDELGDEKMILLNYNFTDGVNSFTWEVSNLYFGLQNPSLK